MLLKKLEDVFVDYFDSPEQIFENSQVILMCRFILTKLILRNGMFQNLFLKNIKIFDYSPGIGQIYEHDSKKKVKNSISDF